MAAYRLRGVGDAVGTSWSRVTAWLERHAPVTAAAVRPPAGAAEIRRVEEAVGRPLPPELTAWWALMDGIAGGSYRAGFPIPPFWMPLPVAGARERWAGFESGAPDECCRPDGTHATAAGEPLFGSCPATLPICWTLRGDLLVADLRDGDQHGCVMEWLPEEGYAVVLWPGVAAMLADTADQLEDPHSAATVEDGSLFWP